MRTLTRQYREYLESFFWRAKRDAALVRAGHRCENCSSRDNLEVHHKNYETFGNERPEDLEVLCIACHERADALRREQNDRRRYRKAVDSYATKKYGEDWADRYERYELSEEFDEWRERRGDM